MTQIVDKPVMECFLVHLLYLMTETIKIELGILQILNQHTEIL